MDTTILIVEDEALIALGLKQKLAQAGYAVAAIEDNAEDALRSVERLRPSLVLMDIRLKGPIDGIEAADRIRRRYQTPVMFVTAHADTETLQRARITEPFGYIVKPFQSVDLRPQIEMALWKHQMEQRLRASEAWLSATFRNVADALIATDRDGNVAFMNPPAADLTGWDWKDSKGKPLLEVFQVFDQVTGSPVEHHLEALYEGREPANSPKIFRLLRRDGSGTCLVEATFTANRDGDVLLGVILVFRDQTSRQRAEEQARQVRKTNALILLSAGLARELAEALKPIDAALAELIPATQDQFSLRLLSTVYERCAYQKSVIDQLTALGNADPGEVVPVDINDVLDGMAEQFKKALGPGRTIGITPGPNLPSVMADPRELGKNLLRLVSDARNAMPDGGSVSISTCRAEANGRVSAQISIHDTGKAIRPTSRERFFDPYYQSRPGSRNPALSLALVYQFVALSGGQIDVDSESGEGVTYLLTLPAAAASA